MLGSLPWLQTVWRTVCPCYGRKNLLHTQKQVTIYTKIKPRQSGFLALIKLFSLCVPALDSKYGSTCVFTSVPNASAYTQLYYFKYYKELPNTLLCFCYCAATLLETKQLADVLSPSNQKENPWQDVSWENMSGSHHAGQQRPSSKLCFRFANQLFHDCFTYPNLLICVTLDFDGQRCLEKILTTGRCLTDKNEINHCHSYGLNLNGTPAPWGCCIVSCTLCRCPRVLCHTQPDSDGTAGSGTQGRERNDFNSPQLNLQNSVPHYHRFHRIVEYN